MLSHLQNFAKSFNLFALTRHLRQLLLSFLLLAVLLFSLNFAVHPVFAEDDGGPQICAGCP